MSSRTIDDASAQLKRLAVLIPTLANGEPHDLTAVATSLGTDVETLRKDLKDLMTRHSDVPPGFMDPVQIQLEANRATVTAMAFRRPFGLTHSELRALEFGLALIRCETPPDQQAMLNDVQSKIQRAAMKAQPEFIGSVSRVGTTATVDAEHFAALRAAIRLQRKAAITYFGANDTEPLTRSVNPYGMINARGRWYLVAFCDRATAMRVFRIDRIREIRVLAHQPAMRTDGFSLESIIDHGRVMIGHPPDTMRVRYYQDIAHWISEHENGEWQPDGSLIVEHPLADEAWAVQHVLQYGPKAEVLSPDSLRAEVAARAQTIAAL